MDMRRQWILHCKNAEMTIKLSFLHFYSVKSIVISAFLQCKIIQFLLFFFNILIFFLNLVVFYIGENEKGEK